MLAPILDSTKVPRADPAESNSTVTPSIARNAYGSLCGHQHCSGHESARYAERAGLSGNKRNLEGVHNTREVRVRPRALLPVLMILSACRSAAPPKSVPVEEEKPVNQGRIVAGDHLGTGRMI